MPSPPAELKFKVMPLNYCDLYVAYQLANSRACEICSDVRDLLYSLGKELGIHTAIKAISGYESPRGLVLICGLLGVSVQPNKYYRKEEVKNAITHLEKLGLLE